MKFLSIKTLEHLNTTLCIGSIDSTTHTDSGATLFKYNTLYRFNPALNERKRVSYSNLNTTLCIGSIPV